MKLFIAILFCIKTIALNEPTGDIIGAVGVKSIAGTISIYKA